VATRSENGCICSAMAGRRKGSRRSETRLGLAQSETLGLSRRHGSTSLARASLLLAWMAELWLAALCEDWLVVRGGGRRCRGKQASIMSG